jgi:hypothetical protein
VEGEWKFQNGEHKQVREGRLKIDTTTTDAWAYSVSWTVNLSHNVLANCWYWTILMTIQTGWHSWLHHWRYCCHGQLQASVSLSSMLSCQW